MSIDLSNLLCLLQSLLLRYDVRGGIQVRKVPDVDIEYYCQLEQCREPSSARMLRHDQRQ